MMVQVPYKSWFAVYEDGKMVKYHLLNDTRDLPTWKREELEDIENWTMVYWVLGFETNRSGLASSRLAFNRSTSIESLWNEVLTHRAANTLPDHPKDKTILTL
jgi:DUF2075 family protein